MIPELLENILLVVVGGGVEWGVAWACQKWWGADGTIQSPRPAYPQCSLPVVSGGQAVCVIFRKNDTDMSHRRIEGVELAETLTCPKGDTPTECYRYSHLDERGRFIYLYERDIHGAQSC